VDNLKAQSSGITMFTTARTRRPLLTLLVLTASALLTVEAVGTGAQSAPPPEYLFRDVRIFDGKGTAVSGPTSVLVRGNRIAAIGTGAESAAATVIDGRGRTLMPGLIDAHAHVMLAEFPQLALLTADIGFVNHVAGRAARQMLLRGFTAIRDVGGPAFGLKRAIDTGVLEGPRIWAAGAMISQTAGHADFRLPNELPADGSRPPYAEQLGFAAIADSPDMVRQRTRENLRAGAPFIKLHAGGGVSSIFDPIDVTQFTLDELRAAVEAARDWGTYVTVHAYTPAAITRAVEAGVQVIDHGQLADEASAKLMADRGVWWSLQPFLDDEDSNPQQGESRVKQQMVQAGTDTAYKLAKRFNVKTAWGTDTLYTPGGTGRMNAKLTKLTRWYAPGEILRMATGQNGELLALSGLRSPYAGRVGVIELEALADLLLVEGDPVANLGLIEDPERNFVVIMKDGRVVKNSVK
jgi:imidazolonepropionase-like amidohydrolase